MPEERLYHQLSLGETLGKTIRIFFGRLDVFLPLSLGVTVPMCLTTVVFVASLVNVKNDDDFWDYFVDHLGSCLSYIVFQAMLYVILFFSVEAAMVRAAAEIYVGKSPQWYACFCQGLNKFSSLLCARLLVWFFLISTLALVVGLSAALVQSHLSSAYSLVAILVISYAGVAFSVWMTTMILYPVIVVERQRPVASLRRAFALSRGMRCYFFCATLCLWVAKLLLLGVLQGLFADASKLSSLVTVAGVIVTAAASLFSLPLTTVLSTVMYMSARARFDHFSQHELLGDLRIEPEDNDGNQDEEVRDELEVPLLADTDAEVEAPSSASPPLLVDNVIVVGDKEVPTDLPDASEVV